MRGTALAERIGIPILGRAWQMLLKGTAEIEAAPDRRAAAEMILIRLCHVSDLPPPGDLVRRLQGQQTPPQAVLQPAGSGPGGGARAAAGGGASLAVAAVSDAAPVLAGFRDVVALAAAEREAVLHGHLLHSVHLVRWAPPVIELRPEPDAPRDLAQRLASLLHAATGTRWTIVLSTEPGQLTLARQGLDADTARRQTAAEHPMVKAILATFPGARIEAVRDPLVDDYGLPSDRVAAVPLGEPDIPDPLPLEADDS